MTNDDRAVWAHRLTDPALFEREQARLGRAWTLLGLTTDIPADGDWFRATLGGRSVFVQRFGDTLHGFQNVCAHRFYPLRTQDRGNGPIRCGFHHWQYNKEGQAVGIPKCADMFGVTPRELDARLTPIDVETCGVLVFGRLSDGEDQGTLEQYLGEGFPILQALTGGASVRRPMTHPVAANWKLTCHISLDDYHLVAVHPDTFGKGGYLDPRVVRYYRFGRHSAYFHGGEDGALSEMAAACRAGTYRPSAFRTFHIFPNVTLAHVDAARTPYVILQQHVAAAVDRTLLRTWCFPVPLPPEDRGPLHGLSRRLVAPWLPIFVPIYTRKIVREDNQVCEGIQALAMQVDGRPMLARHEERIAWFDEAWEEWMGADLPVDTLP